MEGMNQERWAHTYEATHLYGDYIKYIGPLLNLEYADHGRDLMSGAARGDWS